MDGSDVSLAIRRARRSGATSIDLSNRKLRAWPEGLSALRSIKVLDLSHNELSSLDLSLCQLEALEELNLSNNRLEALPELNQDNILPNLRSVDLDGNPMAARLSPATLRELMHPPRSQGQSPVQAIRNLLFPSSHSEGLISRGGDRVSIVSPYASAHPPQVDQAEEAALRPLRGPSSDEASPPWLRSEASLDFDRKLNHEADQPPAWREQQKGLFKEMERLQNRVAELEASDSQRPAGNLQGLAGGSALPSWLQKDTRQNDMNASLPSRRHGLTEDNEAADLRNQLREEQRKSKRLETEVKRLTDRLSERDMTKGAIGSCPHFEIDEAELGEIINQGGFSVVHKGTWHSTKVAIKKLFDPKINEELLAEFDNEVGKLEQIRHPNILQLLAVHRKPPALSLICELVEGGSYFQLLHAPQQFNSASGPVTAIDPSDTMQILEFTAVALRFLHARGIVHRDVKSHNVLLTPHLEVKLCDFGLARMRSELMTGVMQFAGTPNYMAPEIFRQQRYTEKIDVFAFGILLWEAMAQDIPFANLDPPEIKERVLMGQMLPLPGSTPRPVQALTQACWTLDQESRPMMAEVLANLRECIRDSGPGGASRSRRPRTADGGSRR